MASAATLATLRNRIRTQVAAASGFTGPLPVVRSAIELTAGTPNLRDRLEAHLQDSGNLRWSTDDLDEAIRTALEQYSHLSPDHAIGTVTVASNTREIDISSLTTLIRVEKIWWDYDASTPGFPPTWRQFQVWPGSLLYVDDTEQPATNDVVRVWYTKAHTIKGLDSAAATTVPAEDIPYILAGAAYYASRSRALELSEELNVDRDVTKRLTAWADEQGKTFRYGARAKQPAWQRYAYAYDQGDLDEAIRWALHRYCEVAPDKTITTLTLSASGREVDISSITDEIAILRVWWDYDSTAPNHPPNWRNFEVWPGDLLYINDPGEPQSGDKVRIWYTRLHTIDGLDSATATTIPEDAATLIVTGAAGYATQERVQEQPQRYVPRKLREWADARLREFERSLKRLARRLAAHASGIAGGPDLDRWDTGSGGWA